MRQLYDRPVAVAWTAACVVAGVLTEIAHAISA